MSEALGPAQLDKLFQTTYLILFDPKPELSKEQLNELWQYLYDLRRHIPDILSIRIKENELADPSRVCSGLMKEEPFKEQNDAA